jgi:putative transposase
MRSFPAPGTSGTRAAAEAAIDVFADKYGAKYDKSVTCLTKDREALLAFFDFPAEHWIICARQTRSKACSPRSVIARCGALSATTAKLMVFKLVTPPPKLGGD